MSFCGIINKCKDCVNCTQYCNNNGNCIGSFKEQCENYKPLRQMTFEEALKAMREGKYTRIKDEDKIYSIKKGHLLCLTNVDITDVNLDGYDIMSEDWEIVDE